MELTKELKALRSATEESLKKIQEIKANGNGEESPQYVSKEMIERICCGMSESLTYIHQRISSLENSFYNYTYEHSKGHLPQIKSVTSMEKLLKAAGMEKEYSVYKPTIVIASTPRGPQIDINYKK